MTVIRYETDWFCLFGVLAKILRSHAYVPPKRELGDQSIVVPPKSMGGNLCILFKAQDDEAKRVFCVLFKAQEMKLKGVCV